MVSFTTIYPRNIDITGDYVVNSISASGNVSANNIKSDHLLYANGSPYVFTTNAAGSNTQIQFNDGNSFAGSANLTFNKTSNTLTVAYFSGDGSNVANVNAKTLNGHSDTYFASTTYVDNAVANLVNSAPSALDTLNELANALGNDASFSTTITNSLANKLSTSSFSSTANTWIATQTTSNLSEGTNLYFTDARANIAIDNRVTQSFVNNLAVTANVANSALTVAGANVTGFVPNANVANTALSIAGANITGWAPNANIANIAYSVAGSNVSGWVGNANIANIAYSVDGGNVSGEVDFAATANSVAVANVSGIGNIATINLDGNSSNILYGNGTFASAPVTYGDSNVAAYLPNYTGNLKAANLTITAKTNLGNVGNITITGGSNGQYLSTDGNGNISWSNVAGGATSYLASVVDTFTGDGNTVTFTLSAPPGNINQTVVNYNGALQLRSAYSVAGNVITFTEAPADGSTVEVTAMTGVTSTSGTFTVRHYTGDNSTTTFAVSGTVNATSILVTLNGVLQSPTLDYTVSNGTLTFLTAPSTGERIQIRELNAAIADATISGGGVAGSNTQLQFNDAGSFGGNANLTFNKTTNTLNVGNISVTGNILPSANITYDLGSSSNRFKDLYLSNNSIHLGDIIFNANSVLPFSLSIAPEVLTINADAPFAGNDIHWLFSWNQSTLPYARTTIVNQQQASVPLYKQGTYQVNNFANEIHGNMDQRHMLFLKWVDGAGLDNTVSWAANVGNVSFSDANINGGATTTVQRTNITVPASITIPTLTLPANVYYNVAATTSGVFSFTGMGVGDNRTIGPLYRGATYTFNLDTSLGDDNKFYLTTDNGTAFVAGQYVGEYTSGVTGSRGNGAAGYNTLTFTVPNNAPDVLYYQSANVATRHGAMIIKDLAVETNVNGNYVLYFQHMKEGHKTPVEIRPIPSMVNQMCLVYDATVGQFVPQDMSTYVENTPSFKNKIREVAGTATLIAPNGVAVVPTVLVVEDTSYLPLVNNKEGDIAFDSYYDTMYVWSGNTWNSTKSNLSTYATKTDVGNSIANLVNSAPSTLDTLNELANALGNDASFSTTITNSLANKLNSNAFTYANISGAPTLGNIVTINKDGNSSNILYGNGVFASAPVTYGNSNVATLLSSFGSNTITTTGNVTVGNIIATNVGNVASINKDGNASNILYGNGVFAAAPTSTYANANVATYLPTYTGNLSPGNITIPVANLKISGGTANYVLKTDGAGNLSWTAMSGGTQSYVREYVWKGAVTENTGSLRLYIHTASTLTGIYAYVAAAGLTQTTAVVKKNGTSINTITIPANTSNVAQSGLSLSLAANDYLTVDITQSSSAYDLYINFVYTG